MQYQIVWVHNDRDLHCTWCCASSLLRFYPLWQLCVLTRESDHVRTLKNSTDLHECFSSGNVSCSFIRQLCTACINFISAGGQIFHYNSTTSVVKNSERSAEVKVSLIVCSNWPMLEPSVVMCVRTARAVRRKRHGQYGFGRTAFSPAKQLLGLTPGRTLKDTRLANQSILMGLAPA